MIKYKIALINVFWSEYDQNTRYFVNENEQKIYFDTKASGRLSPFVNFNMRDNIVTQIAFRFDEHVTLRPEEIVKSNYAVLYGIDDTGESETIISRRYFFAYCRQDSGGQMIVDLSLDDIQTNYFQYKVYYNKALIRRAHLNRFKPFGSGGSSVIFDLDADSPLYEPEPVGEQSKRLIKRTPLNLNIDTNEFSGLNRWMNDNIIGWEYVYLTPKSDAQEDINWNVYDPTQLNVSISQYELIPRTQYIQPIINCPYEFDHDFRIRPDNYLEGNRINGSLICLCAPVYKHDSLAGSENVLKSGSDEVDSQGKPKYQIALSLRGLDMFLEENGNNSYVYARKFSIRPPFKYGDWDSNTYYLDEDNNNLVFKDGHTTTYQEIPYFNCVAFCSGKIIDNNELYRQGCLVVLQDSNVDAYKTDTFEMDSSHRVYFNVNEIIDADKNYIFNPKLLSSQFYEIGLTSFSQKYTYDPLKLGGGLLNFTYNEALTPDLTKGYARLSGSKNLYIADTNQNLTGLVLSNDQSLMVANDKLSEVLANNKNFFLQQGLQIGMDALGKLAKGNVPGAIIGAGASTLNTYMLEYDNMRASPSQVKNANGNVYFASQIQPFKLAVEEYDILAQDKEKINDYMYLYGFAYNRIDTLANFMNIRAYFNYIEADLISNTAPISNDEKTRIKDKFSRGVRFWNTDLIDYSKENYELSLLQLVQEVNNG